MESPNNGVLEVSQQQFPTYLFKLMSMAYDEKEKFWGFDINSNKLINYKKAEVKVILVVKLNTWGLPSTVINDDRFSTFESKITISVEKDSVKNTEFKTQLLCYQLDYKHIEEKQAWAIAFSYAKKYASKYQNYFVIPSVWMLKYKHINVFLIEKNKLISLSNDIWNFIVNSAKEVSTVKLENLIIDESSVVDMDVEQNEQSEPEPTDRADILKQKLSSQ